MSALKVIQVPAAFNTAGLNIVWILVGLIAIYAGIKNLLDEENPSRIGTAIFWCSFGIVTALGTWLPAKVSGQGFRCPCYYYVSAADLQESKGWKNKRTGKSTHRSTV